MYKMKKLLAIFFTTLIVSVLLNGCKKDTTTNPDDNNNNNQDSVSMAQTYSDLPAEVRAIISSDIFDTMQQYDFPFYIGDTPPDLFDTENLFTNNTPKANQRILNSWSCIVIDEPKYNAGNCNPNNTGTPYYDNRFYFKPNTLGTGSNAYTGYYLESYTEEDPYDLGTVPLYSDKYSEANFRLYGSNYYFSGVFDCSIYKSAAQGTVKYHIIFSGEKSRLLYAGTNSTYLGIKNFRYLKVVMSPSPASGRPYGVGSGVDIIDNDGKSYLVGL